MANKKITLEFHGGAGEVTGACYLLKGSDASILIDCGMFQGHSSLEKLNYEPFSFEPSSVDAVFITHSHLDHVGRLPKLVRDGFGGIIYSTSPTKDLSKLILDDALHLVKEHKNAVKGFFDDADVERTMARWKTLDYGEPVSVGSLEVLLKNSGHILGSSMIEVYAEGKKILFTGDFGNIPSVLLPSPDPLSEGTDYLIIESTYGNRTHGETIDRTLQLERAIEDTVTRGGTLMIPAFATERTQDILYELNSMVMNHRVPQVPVFVDSPLAAKITDVYRSYPDYYNKTVFTLMKKDPAVFDFKGLKFTVTKEESKAINDIRPPKVVVAGSGSSMGGRILHHEARYLSDPRSILLVVGYQAGGSLGRRLLDGEKTVTILNQTIPVHAEVRNISGYSAHADEPQLYDFMRRGRTSLAKVFIVQGEAEAATQLAQDVKDRLGISAEIPALYDSFALE